MRRSATAVLVCPSIEGYGFVYPMTPHRLSHHLRNRQLPANTVALTSLHLLWQVSSHQSPQSAKHSTVCCSFALWASIKLMQVVRHYLPTTARSRMYCLPTYRTRHSLSAAHAASPSPSLEGTCQPSPITITPCPRASLVAFLVSNTVLAFSHIAFMS